MKIVSVGLTNKAISAIRVNENNLKSILGNALRNVNSGRITKAFFEHRSKKVKILPGMTVDEVYSEVMSLLAMLEERDAQSSENQQMQ